MFVFGAAADLVVDDLSTDFEVGRVAVGGLTVGGSVRYDDTVWYGISAGREEIVVVDNRSGVVMRRKRRACWSWREVAAFSRSPARHDDNSVES